MPSAQVGDRCRARACGRPRYRFFVARRVVFLAAFFVERLAVFLAAFLVVAISTNLLQVSARESVAKSSPGALTAEIACPLFAC